MVVGDQPRCPAKQNWYVITFIRYVITFIRYVITFIRYVITFIRYVITFIKYVITFIRYVITFISYVITFIRYVITFIRYAQLYIKARRFGFPLHLCRTYAPVASQYLDFIDLLSFSILCLASLVIWVLIIFQTSLASIIHLLHAGEGNMKIYSPKSIIFPEGKLFWFLPIVQSN